MAPSPPLTAVRIPFQVYLSPFRLVGRSAQRRAACLTSCISDANTDTCDPADTACLCNNQTFVNSITSCVQSTCDADSVQAAAQSASALCQAAVSGLLYIDYVLWLIFA